jgi:hypothetical protein
MQILNTHIQLVSWLLITSESRLPRPPILSFFVYWSPETNTDWRSLQWMATEVLLPTGKWQSARHHHTRDLPSRQRDTDAVVVFALYTTDFLPSPTTTTEIRRKRQALDHNGARMKELNRERNNCRGFQFLLQTCNNGCVSILIWKARAIYLYIIAYIMK